MTFGGPPINGKCLCLFMRGQHYAGQLSFDSGRGLLPAQIVKACVHPFIGKVSVEAH